MLNSQTRQVHAFDIVKGHQAFFDNVPSIIATAVQKARAQAPNHPPFAIGVIAHFIAHHDLAMASGDGFYPEDHLVNQCRGTFVLSRYGKRFLCFLASGRKIDEVTFKVHRKGAMTVGAPPEQGVLFLLDDDAVGEGSHFFLVIEGFTDGRKREWRKIHLVWGRLIDRTTLRAEFSHQIGEEDLGVPTPFTPAPGLPPIEDAVPLIDVEESDE